MKYLKYCLSALVVLIGMTAVFASCGKNSRVASISIIPAAPEMARGTTLQLGATSTFSDGNSISWSLLSWSSSDPTVATIVSDTTSSVNGQVTSFPTATTATTTITATDTMNGLSNSVVLTVKTPLSLTIYPLAPSMAVNTNYQFTAVATFADGFVQDVTKSVLWTTSDPAIAKMDIFTNSTGIVYALSTAGTATVTAVLSGETMTATVPLIVTATPLVSITVSPVSPTLAISSIQQFRAIGTYQDPTTLQLTTRDLTDSVTWNSSNSTAVSISNTVGSNGLANAVAAGTSSVTATDPVTKVWGGTTVTVAAQ